MARSILNDKLMSHQFHLLDVDFSMSLPPWVLLPSIGFSSITSPEITIDTDEVKEGTDPFVHHILGKASTNTLTLQRGVSAFNSDFWRWISACLMGNGPYKGNVKSFIADTFSLDAPKVPAKRRDLILLHLTGINPASLFESAKSEQDYILAGLLAGADSGLSAANKGLGALTNGVLSLGVNSIAGKAYMLFGCQPTRYKPASDFDASSSEVSLEELDLSYHRFEEFAISG